ncbi:type VII secretion target [Salinibacterium sp.]|uniref:type VII secretion target n=1 Tax=Salinibacterium sp. TaxID=1915057 RepID=UPI00286C4B61|nr:type VII secretion target [Salinibacterium sp.]
MSDSLQVDVAALRAAANSLRGAADSVPVGTAADASGSGSAAVAAAVENVNMWARLSGQILAGKLRSGADTADLAATTFERTDAAMASALAGG